MKRNDFKAFRGLLLNECYKSRPLGGFMIGSLIGQLKDELKDVLDGTKYKAQGRLKLKDKEYIFTILGVFEAEPFEDIITISLTELYYYKVASDGTHNRINVKLRNRQLKKINKELNK